MLVVPTQAVPSQSLQTQVANQPTQLNIYQYAYGLFADILVGGSLLLGGVLCLNACVLLRDQYWGYSGDFCFFDTQGNSDPLYTGLGARWQLLYLAPGDLPPGLY